MATYNKLPGFVEHLAEKVHNLGTDTLAIAITNTAPGSEAIPPTGATGANILANLTQISYVNLSPRLLTTTSSGQVGGVYRLSVADLVLTASGAVGPMRFFYVYNDTALIKPLICYADYGSSISLALGEPFTVDFGPELFSLG